MRVNCKEKLTVMETDSLRASKRERERERACCSQCTLGQIIHDVLCLKWSALAPHTPRTLLYMQAACYKASVVFGQTKRICTQPRIVPFNYSPFYSYRNTLRNLFANWLDFLRAHADLMNKTSAHMYSTAIYIFAEKNAFIECCLLWFCI